MWYSNSYKAVSYTHLDVYKRQALERINRLLDEGSFVEVGALVSARTTDFTVNDQSAPSDGCLLYTSDPVYLPEPDRRHVQNHIPPGIQEHLDIWNGKHQCCLLYTSHIRSGILNFCLFS